MRTFEYVNDLYAELAFSVLQRSNSLYLKQCIALLGYKSHNNFCFSSVKVHCLNCKISHLKYDFVNAYNACAVKHDNSI